jgi:hypothetical protein
MAPFVIYKPNYDISIEKEGIVIGCPRVLHFKPSNSGQVYSVGVHIFFFFFFLSMSLSQSIAAASLIIAKLMNFKVKKYFASHPIKHSAHCTRCAMCT